MAQHIPYQTKKKATLIIRGAFDGVNLGGNVTIGPAPGFDSNPWAERKARELTDGKNLVLHLTAEKVTVHTTGAKKHASLAGTGQILVTTDNPVTNTTIDVEEISTDPCA